MPLIVLAKEHNKTLIVSKRYCGCDDLQVTDESVVGVMIRFQPKRQYAAEAGGHLLFCHIMSFMALQFKTPSDFYTAMPDEMSAQGAVSRSAIYCFHHRKELTQTDGT